LTPLQWRQAVTTFIHESRPPRDIGRMWSRVSRRNENSPPQYPQTWRSRRKSSRLLSGGTWLKPFIAIALPLIAMMEWPLMLERSPVRREIPPWAVNATSPSVHATRFFA
jgi:hypothetical protein